MANVDQYLNDSRANRQRILDEGARQGTVLQHQGDKYSDLEDSYRDQGDKSAEELAQTPGYTDDEAGAIRGNPNAGMGYYNPDELRGDMEQGNSEVSGAASGYGGGIRSAADRGGDRMRTSAGNIRNDAFGAGSDLGNGVKDAAERARGDLNAPANDELGWQGGVYNYQRGENEGAYGDLDKGLNSAVDSDKLSLSKDFSDSYKLSPEQSENIKDVAGNTVRGQYQKLGDEVERRAAAQGNTSPAAIAAIKQSLMRDGAADAGDAMGRAELQANTVAAGRNRDIEGMRLGAQQDLSTRQTGAASSRYGARQGAAKDLTSMEMGGIQDVTRNREDAAGKAASLGYDAAQTAGNARVNAANTAGKYDFEAANGASDLDYKAAESGGQAGMKAAEYGANNRQQVNTGIQKTGQELATAADNTASTRATGVAQQRIAGQDKVRGYYTGQQGAAQQGQQTATGQGIQSTANTNSATNQATGQGMDAAIAKDNKPGVLDKVLGAAGGILGGAASVAKAFNDGGVATEPTEAIIGESRPEKVVKLGRYGSPMPSARGDGTDVPGNEPGGANGRYGRFGQRPDQEPTDAFKRETASMSADPMMANGGVVTKPTRVLLGDDGPEAVIPLDGHAGSKITPGMMQPRRYRMTGPAMTHHPMGIMPPAMLDKQMNNSPRYRR